jgi:hypothetical protein
MEELSRKIRKNDGKVKKIHHSINKHTHLHPDTGTIQEKRPRTKIKHSINCTRTHQKHSLNKKTKKKRKER